MIHSFKKRTPLFRASRSRTRRRGVIAIYVALGLLVFLGITGLVVDMGHLYRARARMQQAADAAALAGAIHRGETGDPAPSDAAAQQYATLNGYAQGVNNVSVVGKPIAQDRYNVVISRPEPVYFMRAFGLATRTVTVTSTAVVVQEGDLAIDGGGKYGMTNGFANPSTFGPAGLYQFGDPYSTEWNELTDSPNTYHQEHPNGYDYTIHVPSTYDVGKYGSQLNLEIFDPDCNTDNGDGWDEIRDPIPATRIRPRTFTPQRNTR